MRMPSRSLGRLRGRGPREDAALDLDEAQPSPGIAVPTLESAKNHTIYGGFRIEGRFWLTGAAHERGGKPKTPFVIENGWRSHGRTSLAGIVSRFFR